MTRKIFSFADLAVGRMPGGMAQVNIFAGLLFAGVFGAALAAIGGLDPVTVKSMEEKGFSKSFASGITISSATVGPIFPRSIPLILYGSVASVSIVNLLLAGIEEIVSELAKSLLSDLPYVKGDTVSVLINGLGAKPKEELYVIYKSLYEILSREGIKVFYVYVGEFATSMEMAGASISLLKMDDELIRLLSKPAQSPFFEQKQL